MTTTLKKAIFIAAVIIVLIVVNIIINKNSLRKFQLATYKKDPSTSQYQTTTTNGPKSQHHTTTTNGPKSQHHTTTTNGPKSQHHTTTTNGPNLLIQGKVQYNESKLAHRLLDGKRGIEIGASMHNPFGLDAWNVDYTDDPAALFQKTQLEVSGKAAKVHIISPGDKLPFTNNSVDFVINSHVLEHFYDPIKAIEEWLRIVKPVPCGYVYMDIPHKERTFDRPRNRTTLAELIERHRLPKADMDAVHEHQSVWITEDVLELCRHFNWTVVEWRDQDDKLGIGFTIVLKKA